MKLCRWVAGVAVVGTLMILMYDPEDPPPQTRVEVQKVEVEKTVEVKVPIVPQECKDLATYSAQLYAAVAKYEEEIGGHQDVIESSYDAIVQRDIQRLIKAEERHRKLKSDTLEILLDIRSISARVANAQAACVEKTR